VFLTLDMENKKIDILHVIGAFCAGGAERFVSDLLLALSRKGANVGVIALSNRLDSVGEEMKERIEFAGLLCDRGPTDSVGLRSVLWYIATLRVYRPCIVHLHTENTELAHWLSRPFLNFNPQIVRTMHNVKLSTKHLHRLAIRGNYAAVSIACGPAVAKRYDAEVRGRLVTIPNGIDFNWPIQTIEIKRLCQKELGIESREFHFLHVGSMNGTELHTAQKAQNVLIASWRKSGLGKQGGQLHLIGDGNLRSLLEQSAAGDNSIVFYGVRPDVKKWLLATDCFVMPSRYEGLPIAAIEAFGTGLPCIFSDIEPLMSFSGSSVLRMVTDDVLDLAHKLSFARHRTLEINAAEVQQARKHYGIEKTAGQYAGLYKSLRVKRHFENHRPAA
jgi:glycosyltransferase involved in cell wall biosynthesis